MAIFLVAGATQSVYAQNLLITDYRVPVSRASSLLVDFNYTYAREGLGENADVKVNKGNIGSVYKSFYESLPYAYSVDLIGSRFQDFVAETNSYSSELDARVKKYAWKDRNLFGSLRFGGRFAKGFDQPATDVTIGVGYGRFINATPLAKAVRIEDFLLQEDLLIDDLPAETMIALGHIIEREGEYKSLYGEIYKKNWYEAMEREVETSGMLKGEGIGSIGILRIDEVLSREKIFDRFYGWDASLGIKLDITTPETPESRLKSSKSASAEEKLTRSADISFRYSKPISWRTQFNLRLSGNSPIKKFAKSYNLSSATDFSYEITNRIDLLLRYLTIANKPVDKSFQFITHSFGISFIFYIENYINLIVSEKLEKIKGQPRATNFDFTLNYRIF